MWKVFTINLEQLIVCLLILAFDLHYFSIYDASGMYK